MSEVLRSVARFLGDTDIVDSLEDPLTTVSAELLLLAVSC